MVFDKQMQSIEEEVLSAIAAGEKGWGGADAAALQQIAEEMTFDGYGGGYDEDESDNRRRRNLLGRRALLGAGGGGAALQWLQRGARWWW